MLISFLIWYAGHPGFCRFRALGSLQLLVTHSLILGENWSKNLIKGGNHLSSNRLLHWPIISFYWNQYHLLSITGTRVAVVASEGSKTWFYQIWEQLQNTLSLWSCIPERARYMNMQLCLLCTFLPSVAWRMTNRHTISFICCLKCISKSIYEYVDTQWLSGYADT